MPDVKAGAHVAWPPFTGVQIVVLPTTVREFLLPEELAKTGGVRGRAVIQGRAGFFWRSGRGVKRDEGNPQVVVLIEKGVTLGGEPVLPVRYLLVLGPPREIDSESSFPVGDLMPVTLRTNDRSESERKNERGVELPVKVSHF